MHKLIWKFWLASCVAVIATFLVSALLINQWHRFQTFNETQARPALQLQALASELEQAWADGRPIERLLTENSLADFGHTFLIDPTGADVLGRAIPQEILGSDPVASGQTRERGSLTSIFARAVRSPEGTVHFMIFQFATPEHPLWIAFQRLGLPWVVLATLLVCGLIAAALAWLVVHPLQQLMGLSRRQGRGELQAEVPESLLLRRDEIGQLGRQLQKSALEIERLLQRQRDLVRDVSHEVRAPLARLQIAAERLEITPQDTHALSQMQREVQVMDRLVQGVLQMSRSDHHLSQLTKQPVVLKDVLRVSVEAARLLGSAKGIEVNWRTDIELPQVIGDAHRLAQVFDNLFSNAVRHTPEGGSIWVDCGLCPQGCHVSVGDEGPGVPTEALDTIFEPFVRLDAARSPDVGGFGVGLALVKSVTELHGGTVTARNRHKGGLRVTVTLPTGERNAA